MASSLRSVRRSPGSADRRFSLRGWTSVSSSDSGIGGHLDRGVHPGEVVPLEVAEEHVASWLEPDGHLPGRPVLDALDLVDRLEAVLVDAEAIDPDRQILIRQIGSHDDELV